MLTPGSRFVQQVRMLRRLPAYMIKLIIHLGAARMDVFLSSMMGEDGLLYSTRRASAMAARRPGCITGAQLYRVCSVRTLQSSELRRKGGSKAATRWVDESPKRRVEMPFRPNMSKRWPCSLGPRAASRIQKLQAPWAPQRCY